MAFTNRHWVYVFGQVMGLMVAFFVVQSVCYAIGGYLFGYWADETVQMVGSGVLTGTTLFVIMVIAQRWLGLDWVMMGVLLPTRVHLASGAWFIGMVGLVVYELVVLFLTNRLNNDPSQFLAPLLESRYQWWLFVLIVFVVPFYEELLFRGAIFGRLMAYFNMRTSSQNTKSVVLSTLITSLLFALAHWQYDGFGMGMVFVFSLFLCLLRAYFSSLYLPIVMHAINNGVAMTLMM